MLLSNLLGYDTMRWYRFLTRGKSGLIEVQTMLCLLPVMGFEDELEERHDCGTAHHQPIYGNKEGPADQIVAGKLHATNQMRIGVEKVPEDQTERSHIEDWCRKQGVI